MLLVLNLPAGQIPRIQIGSAEMKPNVVISRVVAEGILDTLSLARDYFAAKDVTRAVEGLQSLASPSPLSKRLDQQVESLGRILGSGD